MPKLKITGGSFTLLPNSFIDTYMPNSKSDYVKVYLYLLRLATSNIEMDNTSVARCLGLNDKDISDAISYWQEKGVLQYSNGCVEFFMNNDFNSKNRNQSTQQKQPLQNTTSNIPEYSNATVSESINSNMKLKELFLVVQQMLGKTLSTSDTKTLYSLHDWLGMEPTVITILVEHCIAQGKPSIKYMEKVAIAWAEMGITSQEAANVYIKSLKQKEGYIYNVRKILSILDRKLTPKEEQFITSWSEVYLMNIEMIAFAYELCVMQTGKLTMPYIDKILQSWHSNGIHTIEAANNEMLEFRKNKSAQPHSKVANQPPNLNVYDGSGYDYSELDRRATQHMNSLREKK